METKQKNGKKLLIGIIAFVVLICALVAAYIQFKPDTAEGSKKITIEVIDDEKETKSYTVKTDAEYLRGALDDTKGLTYEGEEDAYGFMITSVNGLKADFAENMTFWAIYVNGEYAQYGVDSQPVADGDTFTFEYDTSLSGFGTEETVEDVDGDGVEEHVITAVEVGEDGNEETGTTTSETEE